jgi:predicted RNase H-like HicB family nuclease
MENKALTYTLEIERHDDAYLAYFPALPGCQTWGKTYEAAVRYAEEALSGYLETLASTAILSRLNPISMRPCLWGSQFGRPSSASMLARVYQAPGRGKLSKRWSERASCLTSRARTRSIGIRRPDAPPRRAGAQQGATSLALEEDHQVRKLCEAPITVNSRHIPW